MDDAEQIAIELLVQPPSGGLEAGGWSYQEKEDNVAILIKIIPLEALLSKGILGEMEIDGKKILYIAEEVGAKMTELIGQGIFPDDRTLQALDMSDKGLKTVAFFISGVTPGQARDFEKRFSDYQLKVEGIPEDDNVLKLV